MTKLKYLRCKDSGTAQKAEEQGIDNSTIHNTILCH